MKKPTNVTPPNNMATDSWGSYDEKTKEWSLRVANGKLIREWIQQEIKKANAEFIIRDTKNGKLLKFATAADRDAYKANPSTDKVLKTIDYSTYTPPLAYTAYYVITDEALESFPTTNSVKASITLYFNKNYVYIAIPTGRPKFTAVSANNETLTNQFEVDNTVSLDSYTIYKLLSALPLDVNVTINFRE